ncbi:MAG: nucleotide sugar dehydrogenase, partial [Terriglobia bacterium]
MDRISVVGLGKLGACLAACFAARGFDTLGVDMDNAKVDAVNHQRAPVAETNLEQVIRSGGSRLRASCRLPEAVEETDITFVVVPTPSEAGGNFSLQYVREALEVLASALARAAKPYHLFVITSTVSPGSCDQELIPLVERVSGRRLHSGFGFCYNPEFIALGSVVQDFLNPDLVLIGESDRSAGERLARLYSAVCENNPYVARMSLVSSEIAKIALNSYVTMKISFANTLANICEAIPGTDVDAITAAIGADKRIAPYYLKGGLGYGGPCFPRDNKAFATFAHQFGCSAHLARATDEVNDHQMDRLVEVTLQCLAGKKPIVAILGLAYKPKTYVTEESAGIRLAAELLQRDIRVIAFDPLAAENHGTALDQRITLA